MGNIILKNTHAISNKNAKLITHVSHVTSTFFLSLPYETLKKVHSDTSSKCLVTWLQKIFMQDLTDDELKTIWEYYFDGLVFQSVEISAKDIAMYYVKNLHIYSALTILLYPVGWNNSANIINDGDNAQKLLFQNNKICPLVTRALNDFIEYLPQDLTQEYECMNQMPELAVFYYDSGYDYKTGKFTEMSPISKQNYDLNVATFYTFFTNGSKNVDDESITSFSDIKWADCLYTCKQSSQTARITEEHPRYNHLFAEFGRKMRTMICKHTQFQIELFSLYMQLFKIKTISVEKEVDNEDVVNIEDIEEIEDIENSEDVQNIQEIEDVENNANNVNEVDATKKTQIITLNTDLNFKDVQKLLKKTKHLMKLIYYHRDLTVKKSAKVLKKILSNIIFQTTVNQLYETEKIRGYLLQEITSASASASVTSVNLQH